MAEEKNTEEVECDCDDGVRDDICGTCHGSGEGQYDESTCTACRGKGNEMSYCDCKMGQKRLIEEVF